MNSIINSSDFELLFKNVKERKDFAEVKKVLQASLLNYFENQTYSVDELKVLQDRLYKMIDYAIKRYDDYSTQRHRYLTLGVGFIGSAAALLGIYATNFSKLTFPFALFGAISLLALFLSGIVVLILYNNSITPEYPHREIMDIKSWYFKYKLDDTLESDLDKEISKAKLQVRDVAKNYLNGVEDWVMKSKAKNYFVKEDLEQVAILHLLQKYGRDSLDKMKMAMNAGILLFAVFFVVGLLFQLVFM